MSKEKQKTVANPVGATISCPHFEGMAKKQNGITLIALIITIILMLILVAVSVTVALNGGLFSTAKKGVTQTDIAAEKETMVSIVMGAVKQDGEVDYKKLEENLPKGFEKILEGKYKSGKTGVIYTVEKYGTLTYEEPFNAEEWDANASEADCFVWASDTPGTEGYGTVIGYTEKAQGNTKLVFPSRCTKIEYQNGYLWSPEYADARAYVQGIEKIEIPGSLTFMAPSTFSGTFIFSNVKEVNVGYGVTTIGENAFDGCTSLIRVTIPDSVTRIEQNAFNNCTRLTSIIIPDSVISIGDYVFHGCTSLTNVTIPDSVTSVGGGAFADCTSLTSINLPDNVTSMGEDSFYNTPWYDNQEDGLIYIGKVAYEYKGEMPINTSIEIQEGTKIIADWAFGYCTSLTNIKIPDSVTKIGTCAFCYCKGLTNVTIPSSVTTIGDSAFSQCTGLTNVTIPENIINVGSNAFSGTPWYESQEDGLIYIGKVAYKYKGTMPSNTSIEIREGTTVIAGNTFSNCTGLTSITIPNSVTNIGGGAFSDCTELTNIIIPNSVTNIGGNAFLRCTSLKDVTIPDSIKRIESGTFHYCTSLENVTIPKNVKYMGEAAFGNCTKLSSIVIWQNVDELGYRAFEGWESTQTVNIEAKSTPSGWHEDWNYGCNAKIEYGYTGQ